MKYIILVFFIFQSLSELSASDKKLIDVSGEFRTLYDYGKTRNGMAAGGHIAVTYSFLETLSAKVAVYSSQPVLGSDSGLRGTGLFEEHNGFNILGEANVKYQGKNTSITIGRQSLNSPLVTSHDAIMIPGLFSGINILKQVTDTATIKFMYLDEMSGRDNLHKKSEWLSMSKVLGASYSQGMYSVGLSNSSKAKNETDKIKSELWYYHIPDTLNTYYASHSMPIAKTDYRIESHYWRSYSEKTFELDTNKNIDYYFIGAQISKDINNFTFKFAYDRMDKKDDSFTIPKAFGNYAIYTYGLRLDAGAYGANIAGSGLEIRNMNAIKFTSIIKLEKHSIFLVGYMIGRSSDSSLQSDMNLLDIAWFSGEVFGKQSSLGVILENLQANSGGVFKSDTKLKLIYKYRF